MVLVSIRFRSLTSTYSWFANRRAVLRRGTVSVEGLAGNSIAGHPARCARAAASVSPSKTNAASSCAQSSAPRGSNRTGNTDSSARNSRARCANSNGGKTPTVVSAPIPPSVPSPTVAATVDEPLEPWPLAVPQQIEALGASVLKRRASRANQASPVMRPRSLSCPI